MVLKKKHLGQRHILFALSPRAGSGRAIAFLLGKPGHMQPADERGADDIGPLCDSDLGALSKSPRSGNANTAKPNRYQDPRRKSFGKARCARTQRRWQSRFTSFGFRAADCAQSDVARTRRFSLATVIGG